MKTVEALTWIRSKEDAYIEELTSLAEHFSQQTGYGVAATSGIIHPDVLTGRRFCFLMSQIAGHGLKWRDSELKVEICEGEATPFPHGRLLLYSGLPHTILCLDETIGLDMAAKQFDIERDIIMDFPFGKLNALGFRLQERTEIERPQNNPGLAALVIRPDLKIKKGVVERYRRLLRVFEIPTE